MKKKIQIEILIFCFVIAAKLKKKKFPYKNVNAYKEDAYITYEYNVTLKLLTFYYSNLNYTSPIFTLEENWSNS